MIIKVTTRNLCSILDLQKVNIKTCSYIKACNDNPMKSSPQRLWICVDMRWSEEQSDVDTPFCTCCWSPGPELFMCQIFWLEYIWLKVVGWPLNHCFKASKSLYHRPVLLNFFEQSLLTSSIDFCWKEICFIMHATLQILNMWNINYRVFFYTGPPLKVQSSTKLI